MPFKCFKCQFYTSTKRYHTQAKQNTTAFFDSSFNYIKQHSQLISIDSLYSQGAKRSYPNPHPANSTTTNYLSFDYNTNNNILVNDDDSNHKDFEHELEQQQQQQQQKDALDHLSPLSYILPYQIDQVSLALNKSNYQQILTKVPKINVSQVLTNSIKLVNQPHLQQQQQQQLQFTPNSSRNLHTFRSLQNRLEHTPQEEQVQFKSQPSSPTLVDEEAKPKYFTPIEEQVFEEQSDATFINQQNSEIFKAFTENQFEKIHSIYMAIKRNNIIPTREIYFITLTSISKRTIDDSIDEKLSTMLNVYQDMIQHKMKPDLDIYSIVINDLLKASIESINNPKYSTNGADFFKIAIDIFKASNSHHVQNFDSLIIDQLLVGMNLYPGLISKETIEEYLNNNAVSYSKTHIYYIALINHCKLNNDVDLAMKLFNDFKIQSVGDSFLTGKQFSIYSSLISTLIHCDEVTSATKFLDKLLSTIKNYSEFEPKLNLVLTSYILALSHKNIQKALEIWFQFNSIDWIPEFSYEFYSNLLNQVNDYQDASKIFNYMCCLSRNKKSSHSLESILIEPHLIKNSISRLILSAVQFNDKTMVLKIIKDSFIKKIAFDYSVYPILSQYLQSSEVMNKLVNNHGDLVIDEYEFLTYITSTGVDITSDLITRGRFIEGLVENYKMYDSTKNYLGLYQFFQQFIFTTIEPIDEHTLELLSSLIIEFYDLDNFYNQIPNQETLEFKQQLTEFFIKQTNTINPSTIKSEKILDAIKLIQDIQEINQPTCN